MQIIKSNGEVEEFSLEKVRDSVVRAGAGGALAIQVANDVVRQLKDGMTTKAVYLLVKEALARTSVCVSCRYSLREALARLGPSGFHFERYVSSLFQATGYRAWLPEEYQGAAIWHEIDVEATKDGKRYAMEVKFRNDNRDHVRAQAVMVAHARFLDLQPQFDEMWVVTNGVFSDRAVKYGSYYKIRLVSWRELAPMIDSVGLYPVTALEGLSNDELARFAECGLMLCKDLAEHEIEDLVEKLGFSRERLEVLVRMAGEIVAQPVGASA